MSDTIKKLREKFIEKKLQLRKRRMAIKANEAKLRALFADANNLPTDCPSQGSKGPATAHGSPSGELVHQLMNG